MGRKKTGAAFTHPKGETIWVTHHDAQGDVKYIVTSNKDRTSYYLYRLVGGELQKLGRGKNPAELEDKYVED